MPSTHMHTLNSMCLSGHGAVGRTASPYAGSLLGEGLVGGGQQEGLGPAGGCMLASLTVAL